MPSRAQDQWRIQPCTMERVIAPALVGAEKEWKMVFADAGAAIFMRTPPPGVQPIASTEIFASMEAQCRAMVDHDPARPRCARSLGHLFTRLGDTARARRWEDLYRNLTGSEP